MKQFFQVCRELDADAYVITTVAGNYSIWHNDDMTIENRPLPSHLGGLFYHLAMVAWFARLAPKLIRFRSRRPHCDGKSELLVSIVLPQMVWHSDRSVVSLCPVAQILLRSTQLAHSVRTQSALDIEARESRARRVERHRATAFFSCRQHQY